MRKISIAAAILAEFALADAQKISSGKWYDLFSYNNVLAMKEANGKIIAATENGIFYYNISSGEITKLSKASGLHDVKISAFDYDPASKTAIIGYQNGGMDVVTPNEIKYIVDIPVAQSYNGTKKINHISITGNLATISVNYGVSIFRVDKKEFGDSAFFTNGAGFLACNEAAIFGNTVYAATDTGLIKHDLNVAFPVYSTWSTVATGYYKQVAAGSVLAYATPSQVQILNGNNTVTLPKIYGDITDVVVNSTNVVVTDHINVDAYNLTGSLVKSVNENENCHTAITYNGNIMAGTQLSGIKDEQKNTYKPDGPYSNVSNKLEIRDDKILVSSGSREGRYNYAYVDPLNLGFYYFNGKEWIYPRMFKGATTYFNVLDAVTNPSDPTDFYFTNYTMNPGQGIYHVKYDDASKDFLLNKFFPSANYVCCRPVGLVFTENNDLFATLSFYYDPSIGYKAGVGVYDKTAEDFKYRSLLAGQSAEKPLAKDGKLYIPLSRTNDFIIYDYKNPTNFSDDVLIDYTAANGLSPNSTGTISVSLDKDDDAWIGTDNGIRILPNAPSATSSSTLEPVIIEENGIGEELMRDAEILQIDTDSGNHKWVSANGSGAFYLSADGQKTLLHFTKENSPLPNNLVTDIKVDQKSGKVYFATRDGIVVYQSDAIDVSDNFGNVQIYPNPVVYSNFKGNVTIRGLAQKTNIRITDTAGNLVNQAVANGGFYSWDLNNMHGVRVSSGIYFVLMTNADGSDKATAKIAVVN